MARRRQVRQALATVLVLVLVSTLSVSPASAQPKSLPATPPAAGAVEKGFVAGKSTEIVAERRETAKVFRNPDGSKTAQMAPVPVHFKDGAGVWADIDNALVPDPSRPGVVRNRANAWTATFAPLPEGVTLTTDEGPLTLAPAGAAPVAPVVDPGGDSVTYPEAWPGVDLRYTIDNDKVKEDIVIKRVPDRTSFAFSTGEKGFTPDAERPGGLAPPGANKKVRLAPPEVLDKNGTPQEAARPLLVPTKAGKTSGLRVSMDPSWLKTLGPEAFPISLDPTFVMGSSNSWAYKSDGYACAGCGSRVGNSRDVQPGGWAADKYWRSVNFFDYTPLFGKPVQAASVYVGNRVAGTANAYPFHVFGANAWNFNGVGQYLGSNNYVGNDGWVGSEAMRAFYDNLTRTRAWGVPLMFVGHEAGGLYTYKQLNYFTLSLTYIEPNRPPDPPVVYAPANGANLASNDPTLTAVGLSDPDANNVSPRFRLWRDGPGGAYVGGKDGYAVCNGCHDSYRTGFNDPAQRWNSGPGNWAWENTKLVEGDFNGDGKGDVAAFYNYGGGNTSLFTFTSNGTGFNPPVHQWNSGPGATWWENIKPVAGDFNGDGRSDVAMFYNYGGGNTSIFTWTSNGTGFNWPVHQWNSGPGATWWENIKPVAGDFNGDGKSDVAMFYNYGGGNTSLFTWTSNGTGFNWPVHNWNSGAGNWWWESTKPVSGDFNGDGKADVAAVYAYPNAQTGIWVFSGPNLNAPVRPWLGCAGCTWWDYSQFVSGDFNGDGKGDIGALYRYGNGNTGLWVFPGPDFTTQEHEWMSCAGCWWAENSALVGGDFNGDRKSDVGALYNYGGANSSLFAFQARQRDALGDGRYYWEAWSNDGEYDSAHTAATFTIDTSPPGPPAVSASPHGDPNRWYASNAPSFSWAANDLSGIDGYSYVLDQAPTTTPDTVSEGAATSRAYTGVADGTWYLHVRARNGAGLWGDAAHVRVQIDTTGSAATVISSSTHGQDQWSGNRDASFTWSAPASQSPITGYSVVFDASPTTTPDVTAETSTTSWTQSAIADGEWYLHVRAIDAAGNAGAAGHYRVRVHATSPNAPPNLRSTTHPDPNVFYPRRDATFAWDAPPSLSGINGYSWVLDQSASTAPDTISEGTALSPTRSATSDGDWWFHVRARSGAGNWGAAAHVRVRIDATNPTEPLVVASTTHLPTVATSNRVATVTWLPGTDATSGVAGYSWAFNNSPSTSADAAADGNASVTSATSPELADGLWWFHVRSIDNAGNASTDKVYGPMVVDPNGPLALASTLLPEPTAQSDELGREQFFPMAGHDLGTAKAYVHLRNANMVVQQSDATVPAQGLNVAVKRTYNSQDPSNPDGLGAGWRLSVTDVDAGLEPALDTVADVAQSGPGSLGGLGINSEVKLADLVDLVGGVRAVTGALVEFSDADGTTHRFVRKGGPGSRWDSPPGVDLRLREVLNAAGAVSAYELIRPDGVTYRAENIQGLLGLPSLTWRVTSVTDRNANQLRYEYTSVAGVPTTVRLAAIKHSRTGERVLVRFDYTNGNLAAIVAQPGYVAPDPATGTSRSWERRTELTSPGGSVTVTHNAQASPADGKRTTTFGYGLLGTMQTVTDARGNTTNLGYALDILTPRLSRVTDRRGKDWTYAYGLAVLGTGERTTTATSPVGAATSYHITGKGPISATDRRPAGGNVASISDAGTDAGPVTSSYEWVANRLVTRTDAAGKATRSEYNDLGLVTKLTQPAPNDSGRADLTDAAYPKADVVSTLTYRHPPGFAYPGCVEPPSSGPVTTAGYCQAVAELTQVKAADSVATQRRVSDYDYDAAGNMTRATERANADASPSTDDRTTTFDYYAKGGPCRVDGPRSDVADVTRYGDGPNVAQPCRAGPDPDYGGYDPTGRAPQIKDAAAKTKAFAFSPYGKVSKVTDRDGRITSTRFDERNRPTEVTDPAGHRRASTYDGNDNVATEVSGRGTETADPDDFTARFTYDANDWPTLVSSPGENEAGPRVEASTAYNDDGTKASDTSPAGAVTTYAYWPNRAPKQAQAPTTTTGAKAVTDLYYDTAGRLARRVDPATDAGGTARPEVQADYTPQGQVSVLRETSAITGQWRTTRAAYNAHGEQTAGFGPRSIGAEEARTQMDRNAFGEVTATRRRLVGKWLTSTTGYDTAGNRTRVTQPTGAGASLESLYRYDALGRLAEQTKDPSNPGHSVDYTYENEGAQLTRVDKAAGTVERTTTTAYNPDGTLQSQVAKDRGGATLATCNWAAGQSTTSGYDADHNLLASRTVDGSAGCAGGTTTRTSTMSYDHRGAMATMTQAVRSPETGQDVVRAQSFAHRGDGALTSATHDGRSTTYVNSPAGWAESLTDWRAKTSTHTYAPAGNVLTDNLGDGAATSTRTYHPDAMPASLTWRGRGGASVRSHTAIDYDIGGLRKSENVSVIQPPEAVGADTGGVATYDYDLADRLTRYTSPYKDAPTDVAKPTTTYTLDDGANVTQQTTTVGSETRASETSTYPNGRLATRHATGSGSTPAEDTTYGYSPLGEEKDRTTTGGDPKSRGTNYDPAGHTGTVDDRSAPTAADVDYAYDGSDNLISRKESPGGAGAKTKLYFYWGMGNTLAEETDGQGATLARYLVDGGDTVAQETYRVGADGHRDPTDTAGTWTWLLDDPSGNVATHVGDDGAVSKQVAFDPYGRPEKGGTGKTPTAPGSSLGFQGAHTDPTTGSVILGPRQYDPTTTRFTSPDVYAAGDLDLGLATDELTGNRYLFAGANPVAYYEDGHGWCWKWPPWKCGKKKDEQAAPPLPQESRPCPPCELPPAGIGDTSGCNIGATKTTHVGIAEACRRRSASGPDLTDSFARKLEPRAKGATGTSGPCGQSSSGRTITCVEKVGKRLPSADPSARAVTLGHYIFCRETCEKSLVHEKVHVEQWERYGDQFAHMYIRASVRGTWCGNPFEKEAYLAPGGGGCPARRR